MQDVFLSGAKTVENPSQLSYFNDFVITSHKNNIENMYLGTHLFLVHIPNFTCHEGFHSSFFQITEMTLFSLISIYTWLMLDLCLEINSERFFI